MAWEKLADVPVSMADAMDDTALELSAHINLAMSFDDQFHFRPISVIEESESDVTGNQVIDTRGTGRIIATRHGSFMTELTRISA